MTSVIRREPRVPPREKIFSKHPNGNWLLRRRVDEWANQTTRDVYIDLMEDYVLTRTWSRTWTVTERFANNSINRPVPRGPALLIEGQEPPGMRPTDEEFLRARLAPILIFRVVRDRDSSELEVTIPFPLVNSQPPLAVIDQVRQSLDAANRNTP